MNPVVAFRTWFNRQRPFVKVGVPFVVFMAGGLVGLQQFVSLKYEVTSVTRVTAEEAAKFGLKKKSAQETEPDIIYETETKKLDIDNWENVRGPRPWEDPAGTQLAKLKEKARLEREKRKLNEAE